MTEPLRNIQRCFLRFLAVTVLLTLVVDQAYSQTTKVSGKITDAQTGEALPFVNIQFKDSKIGTSSDIDGKYEIETYYATDSLIVSYVGYIRKSVKVRKDRAQTLDIQLEPSSVQLGEVEIKADKKDENPAHPIIRAVQANRKINDRDKLTSYEYEVYNKVEFDINNVDEKFQSRKIFKPFQFVFENVDTTGGKPYLPIFMTESLSDFYYRKSPKAEREYIKATQVSGVENESVQEFLGDMYQNVNIYDNYVPVFGKNFVSPISGFGFAYYRYYLMDSVWLDSSWCYQIHFIPKRKQEPCFQGDMWINDTTYAIKKVEASIAEDANINFVNALTVKQEYKQVEKEVWMLTKDELIVDFMLSEKAMGFYGRKATSYRNFIINEPRPDEFYSGPDNIIVADDANEKGEEFWEESRHDTLNENQQFIYHLADTMAQIPAFRTYVDVITLIVSGYKVVGNFEIGPYFSLYAYNPIEGHRLRFGGRTSNSFSTRLMIEGYGAYGFTDKRWKYGAGFQYFLSKKPRRQIFGIYVKEDVEQLGQTANAYGNDNVIASFFRRNNVWKLTRIEEQRAFFEREWFQGLSSQIMYRRRVMVPLGALEYNRFDPDLNETVPVNSITSSEVIFYTRFAYQEKFVSGEFKRISLGTKYPVLEAQYTLGLKGFLNGQYDYEKLMLSLKHKFFLGPLGYTKYKITAGKIWGTLPYPLLELHQGNETYYYYNDAFNTMNWFEFVSDEWASVMVEHHFDGFFFNRIPLFRKLKWREVVTGKAVIGRLDDRHTEVLNLGENMFPLLQENANGQWRPTPFVESAVGIENIFKVLRVDMLYRLSYLDNPNIVKFGIRAKLQIDF